jgi:hypothetical protein
MVLVRFWSALSRRADWSARHWSLDILEQLQLHAAAASTIV